MHPEIIIDSFAGGGGASEGIRAATGRANYAEQRRAAPAPADDAGTLFWEAAE